MVLAGHGEGESSSILEQWQVGARTLAHAAEVMRLPLPLRWVISGLGAIRKRLSGWAGSPHNRWTRAQAAALARALEARLGEPVPVRAAFASSEPLFEELIAESHAACRRVFVSMTPSDSRLSCGLLCRALVEQGAGAAQAVVLARLWDDPGFVELNAAHVLTSCLAWPGQAQTRETPPTALVLALHGTLVRGRDGRPPGFHTGQAEKEHFSAALRFALASEPAPPWHEVHAAYLNHAVGGTWTQPTVQAVLDELSARGFRRAWVFACDYLVESAEIRGELATTLADGPIPDARLLPCLNDSPLFIDFLAARVQQALEMPEGPWRCDPCPRPLRSEPRP